MAFRERLESIVRKLDAGKGQLEPGIDKALAVAAGNAGILAGATAWMEHADFSNVTNTLLMLTTGAGLVAGNYLTLFSPTTERLRDWLSSVNDTLDQIRPLSWTKSGALATALLCSALQLKPYTNHILEQDVTAFLEPPVAAREAEQRDERPTPQTPKQNLRSRPSLYNQLNYTAFVEHNFAGVNLADKDSTIGRIQRTLRWQPVYRAIEDAYGIPRNTLAGMIMEESYGNPVQPNASNDGGLGVVHIQGTTARNYGLHIFGNSHRASDPRHGRQIREMLQDCNYDPACVQEYDERGHLIKVLDTAARIVAEGKEKHGSWDYGVEYYRGPGHVGDGTGWRYLRRVKKWRTAIQDRHVLGRAAVDFEQRNGYPFSVYIGNWHAMSNNWGLETYKASR